MRILFLLGFALFSFQSINAQNKAAVESFNTAVKLYKAKAYDDAIDLFSKSIDADDTFAKAYYYRGNSYVKLKKYKPAINDFNSVLDLDPEHEKANLM